MILKIFSVFDSAVGAYASPMFLHSRAQAVRAFTDAIADPSTNICKHPQDFTLFYLGEYDDQIGRFDSLPSPESCGVASEYLAKS